MQKRKYVSETIYASFAFNRQFKLDGTLQPTANGTEVASGKKKKKKQKNYEYQTEPLTR